MKTRFLGEHATTEFTQALARTGEDPYVLRLYVTGSTRLSTRAVQAVKGLCEQCLDGRYELEVVDLYQQPERARTAQIIAAPTLVKELPLPSRRLIGDLTRLDRLKHALNLKQESE